MIANRPEHLRQIDNPTEHQEQSVFVLWFRRQYPCVRIYAIPNGEKRSKSAASRLKAEGVSAGVPDLHIPAWRCWIEMKRRKKSSVSESQKDWHEYLTGIGDTVAVCKGCDEAISFCESRKPDER